MLFNLAYRKSVPIIPVTGVSLNESSIELSTVGETYQLVATVTPNDATDKSVTWSSSDTSIATVDNTGLVTCVTPGTATITVTTTDGGYTATCGVKKPIDYLCFTANTAGSTVKLNKSGTPADVTLETSSDGTNWNTYTFGTDITLSNVGDKIYFRNTSETTTGFSVGGGGIYQFYMSGSIAGSGDIMCLVNKNSTDEIPQDWCFYSLFQSCSSLTSCPRLTATTLKTRCYANMFLNCTNLETIPSIQATIFPDNCCNSMFYGCSKIKLSSSKTGNYQTEYRLPPEGTGTNQNNAFNGMFYSTGGTFTGTPNINVTYYTSNTVV